MTHIPLRLCVGCGRVFDEIQPKDGQPQWMDAHAYLTKYGLTGRISIGRMTPAHPARACLPLLGVEFTPR